ncbi:hypothetical protein [Paenibacillus sp. 32O-W]|uniref:hypothetical protein n=1 Tax=Paenibacillus sp. 32O-W TaxID=1695218 RepID=UPI0013659F02|nr:hypothetical protein [Paenibacillus sp. 32O-W]
MATQTSQGACSPWLYGIRLICAAEPTAAAAANAAVDAAASSRSGFVAFCFW